jgi:hypothetical protein
MWWAHGPDCGILAFALLNVFKSLLSKEQKILINTGAYVIFARGDFLI